MTVAYNAKTGSEPGWTVYVTGMSVGDGSDYDYFTIAYSLDFAAIADRQGTGSGAKRRCLSPSRLATEVADR